MVNLKFDAASVFPHRFSDQTSNGLMVTGFIAYNHVTFYLPPSKN